MVRDANDTYYLEASSREQRIVKRSTDLDELYYPENKEEYLEIASNVVFERLRRNTDDNEILDYTKKPNSLKKTNMFETSFHIVKNDITSFDNDNHIAYDLENNRVKRQISVTNKNLRYLTFEDNVDLDSKTIDLESLQKKNRPADILEYKRFMKVCIFLSYVCIIINYYNQIL